MNRAFFTLHADLPHEGPGDRDSLDWALSLARPPRSARIFDAGCGPGADIEGLLAHAPVGHISAVDTHAPFIGQVQARWGDDARVTAMVGDMRDPAGPFDLIWCAGALYFLGITEGLRAFRPELAPGGAVAFSELVLFTGDPAAEVAALQKEYGALADESTLRARIAAAGYEMLGMMRLGDAAWENYFGPLDDRIARLRPGADAQLTAVLDKAEAEAALWRRYRDQFGYAVCVVRP